MTIQRGTQLHTPQLRIFTITPDNNVFISGLIRENDNWRTGDQKAEIQQSGLQPTNDLESAIVQDLPANGATYSAIVRGVNESTGIAVVEVYALP